MNASGHVDEMLTIDHAETARAIRERALASQWHPSESQIGQDVRDWPRAIGRRPIFIVAWGIAGIALGSLKTHDVLAKGHVHSTSIAERSSAIR
jgi:hypothetical protein